VVSSRFAPQLQEPSETPKVESVVTIAEPVDEVEREEAYLDNLMKQKQKKI